MKKLILIIICFLSFSAAQAQDYFAGSKNVRRGTQATLPALSLGELYFATDANLLYIGTDVGNRAVYLDSTVVVGGSDAYKVRAITSSATLTLDCSKERVFFINELYAGYGNISFINWIEGILYTIRIHSTDGLYTVDVAGATGGWEDPVTGPIIGSDNATDVFNFMIFGSKVYPKIYGQGY